MKMLAIALKDMTRSFRSAFALVFMFGVPLLMTGMFSLMFGGSGESGPAFTVPNTKVVVANLDQGTGFEALRSQLPEGSQVGSLGDMVLSVLEGKDFASLLTVTRVDSATTARLAVDKQQAGVAVIIPADFTAQFFNPNGQASLELYQDPTLTVGPSIIQSVLKQFMDSLSGTRIAVSVVVNLTNNTDPALLNQVYQQYAAAVPTGDQTGVLLDIQPAQVERKPVNTLVTIIGPIMGWITIFYAFYTSASTAQSILKEDEEGTLPRLFTTPTRQSTVLGGKFLAVGLTTLVQMSVLLILGKLVFRIPWGALLPVSLVTVGTILVAAAFGIFLNSMVKSTKQSGLIFGGLLTVVGMLGGLPIFTGNASGGPSAMTTVSLLVPPGWAVHGLLQTMNAAPLGQVLVTCLVMLAWAVVCFIIGVLRFQKRYA